MTAPALFCQRCDHQSDDAGSTACPVCGGTLRPPLTDKEAAGLRALCLPEIEAQGYTKGFTCDGCDGNRHCAYAFDPYNTAGDCLASK